MKLLQSVKSDTKPDLICMADNFRFQSFETFRPRRKDLFWRRSFFPRHTHYNVYMKRGIFVVLFQHRLFQRLPRNCVSFMRVGCIVRASVMQFQIMRLRIRSSFLPSLSFIFGGFAVRFQCKFAAETMRKLVYTYYLKIKKISACNPIERRAGRSEF